MAIQQRHNDHQNVSMPFWVPYQVMLRRVTSSPWRWTCGPGLLERPGANAGTLHLSKRP